MSRSRGSGDVASRRVVWADRTEAPAAGDEARPASPDGPPPTSQDSVHRRPFRQDIEGLRGIAVLVVLAYHAGLSLMPGGYIGVDVFFVLSGYLITQGLFTELEKTGTIAVVTFYGRRFRRLMPASTLVLIVTVLAARLISSPLVAESIARDGLWAAGWLADQRFISVGLDYLATDSLESPLLHFWSLAVEEQFYLTWPVLLLVVAKLAGAGRRGPLAAFLAAIVVVSLTWSTMVTVSNPTVAYLSLPSRAWELAFGGLIALVVLRPARTTRTLLVGAGLAAIAYSALSFDATTAFPGPMAAIPVLGTGAILLAGASGGGTGRILTWRPLQRAGKLSYSLYLWHWPLLILGAQYAGRDLAGLERAGLLAASWVLAELMFRYLENPLRRTTIFATPRRGVLFGLSLIATAFLVSLTSLFTTPALTGSVELDAELVSAMEELSLDADEAEAPATRAPATQAGARPVSSSRRVTTDAAFAERLEAILRASSATTAVPATLDPSLGEAGGVLPRIYEDGCVGAESNFDDCVYGDVGAQRTVVLFGDSHAAHWFPPLDDLAVRNGWRLVAVTRGGCPTIDVERFYDGVAADDCYRWRDEQVARIISEQPELLVLSNSAVYDAYDADGQVEPDRKVSNLVEGQARTVARLRAGSPATAITVFGASPRLSYEAPVCLADNLTSVGACETDRDAVTVDGLVAAQRVQADADGVGFLDPTGLLCTATHCPLLIGDLLVYWDTHHLSPPLTMWLRPALDHAMFRG